MPFWVVSDLRSGWPVAVAIGVLSLSAEKRVGTDPSGSFSRPILPAREAGDWCGSHVAAAVATASGPRIVPQGWLSLQTLLLLAPERPQSRLGLIACNHCRREFGPAIERSVVQ